MNDITTLLGMCKMKNDASYLGLPLFRSKKRSKDMQYLVQRVLTRIEGWKARLLSKAGRTCLIQSEGTSIPIYVAASEVIPCGALCIFKAIWEARNGVIHGTRLRPITEIVNSVHRSYNDHLSRWKPNNEKRGHLRTSEAGWWNCCTDVSIQPNQSFGAVVFRDEQDRVVTIFAERLSATNPLLAEATILANATEYAREHLKGKVAFQCDNEVVVANCSITCNTNQFIGIEGAINRFRNTVRLLDDFKIRKIDRIYNFMAHNFAKWAAAVGATGVLDLGIMDENVFSDVQEWHPD
ncbi:hypothetical protein G4B88_030075 [Cannabis sativa]|uniref:RNase H type-1 domain-containing protein n=1 Tax=Cannabis sativa TaxID=3483 RepID=A0A7J6FSX4_CANSA|nr:hypothetical protein G4B88_030075 [Cannabis sativa]